MKKNKKEMKIVNNVLVLMTKLKGDDVMEIENVIASEIVIVIVIVKEINVADVKKKKIDMIHTGYF